MLKIDISKAFDNLSWPFLLEVLQELRLQPSLERQGCHPTLIYILFHPAQRATRAKDYTPSWSSSGRLPFSMLFILAVDALNRLVKPSLSMWHPFYTWLPRGQISLQLVHRRRHSIHQRLSSRSYTGQKTACDLRGDIGVDNKPKRMLVIHGDNQ